MTIEEKAIITLKSLKDYYNDKNEDSYVGFDNDDNEALNIAIKVLEERLEIHDNCKKCVEFSNFEQKPCGDLISRTDLIATMHLIMDDAVIGDNDEDYECLEDIKQQYLAIAEGLRGFQLLGANLETVPTNLQDWLSAFNTDSATECFTAVQELKRGLNNEQV